MDAIPSEFAELQVHLQRLREILENLVLRGLRACGPDELARLKSNIEHLERCGAGHVAGVLAELHAKIEKDDHSAAATLLTAQTSVRLLERLLTLRMVRMQYEMAMQAMDQPSDPAETDDPKDED